jgi:hypothetical protein
MVNRSRRRAFFRPNFRYLLAIRNDPAILPGEHCHKAPHQP